MNIKDITEKLKNAAVEKEGREEINLNEDNEKEETKPISDEVPENAETVETPETPEETEEKDSVKLKTVIVKEEEQEAEEDNKKKIKDIVKIAAGVGVAAIGIAALFFKSKNKK